MLGRAVIFALAMMAAFGAAEAGSTETEMSVVSRIGMLPPKLVFMLAHVDMEFTADVGNVADPQGLIAILKRSNEKGQSVTVHYDPETAMFDADSGKPMFVVRRIEFDGKTVEVDNKTPPRREADIASPREKAEFALAKAMAIAATVKSDKVLALLDKALAEPSLPPKEQALGFKTRSRIYAREGGANRPYGSLAADKLTMLALADIKRWAELDPADVKASEDMAWAYVGLGGLPEALDIFKTMLVKWPDEAFWTHVGMAAVYRRMGRFDEALAEVEKIDPKASMPYASSRAYILIKQQRWDDMIVDLTLGIRYQPDWAGAWRMRGCAQAALGHIREALEDQREAVRLNAAYPKTTRTLASEYDDARERFVTRTLERALAAAPTKPVMDLCEGYWDDPERARSSLLPPPK